MIEKYKKFTSLFLANIQKICYVVLRFFWVLFFNKFYVYISTHFEKELFFLDYTISGKNNIL